MLTVRDDGILAVIAPIVAACRVEVAVLVDVGSGMALDTWVRGDDQGDQEALGAAQADVVRALVALGTPSAEFVLSQHGCRHHVVRSVVDPCGGRLALAVVVGGSARAARRALRRIRELPAGCLTAGPLPLPAGQTAREDPPPAGRHRAEGGRLPALAQIDTGWVVPPVRLAGRRAERVVAPRRGPAPPSALPPARRTDRG
jgi:hypothetical protein